MSQSASQHDEVKIEGIQTRFYCEGEKLTFQIVLTLTDNTQQVYKTYDEFDNYRNDLQHLMCSKRNGENIMLPRSA